MSDPQKFISKLRETSERARVFGRKTAIEHYCNLTGAPEADGAKIYDKLAEMFVGCPIVYNMPLDEMRDFCASGKHHAMNNPILTFNRAKAQTEKAMGVSGLDPLYADATQKLEGDRECGDCSVVLRGLDDRVAFVCGDPNRLRNPSRADYVEAPELVLYHRSDMNHCRAAATLLAMTKNDLLGGPQSIMAQVGRPDVDFGKCKALVFGGIQPENIERVIVDAPDKAKTLRQTLGEVGRLLPVFVSTQQVKIRDPHTEREEPEQPESNSDPVRPLMFLPGGRVCMKPAASLPKGFGTVTGVNDGGVTVQWDNGGRTIFDLVEALTILMPMPEESLKGDGMVIYSLPGVSAETLKVLNKVGIDAVSLYSALSHAQPGGDKVGGWRDLVPKLLKVMGIEASMVEGFIPSPEDAELAFLPHSWYEASLPNGVRLVMDIGAGKIKVQAGVDLDDYIRTSHEPTLELE